MNKKEFLEKLRKRLSILTDEEIDDIISEYESNINEKIKKKKMTEAKAVKDFGDFDELVKEILSAYKIDNEKQKKSFDGIIENIGDTVEGFVKSLADKDSSEIIRIIFEVFLILIIIGVCRLPLEIIIELGNSIFEFLPYPIDTIITGIWRFVLEVAYIILAVLFFIKVFKARYLTGEIIENNSKSKKDEIKYDATTKETKTKSAKKSEEVKVVKVEKEEDKAFDFIIKFFVGIIKFFLAIMLIPGIITVLGLIIAFSFSIILLLNGVQFIGVIVCLLALLIFGILMAELIIKFIFDKKNSATRTFATIIIVIIMLGVGITITAVDFASSAYIYEVPSGYNQKTISETFDATDITTVDYWYNTKYIVEESLGDNIVVEVKYYEEFLNPTIINRKNYIEINYYNRIRFSGREIYNLIINDLKAKEFHDYSKLFEPVITVYGSKDKLEKLEKHYYEEELDFYQDEIDRLHDDLDDLHDDYNNLHNNCVSN